MIKIENVDYYGFDAALRGMRNPLNSWEKSDSQIDGFGCVNIGANDFDLMKRLVKSGTDHSKFMRMITVTADITAPLYWWAEMDTYKVGTVRNSCSKMHKLLAKPFEMNDFSFDKLPGYKNEIKQFRPETDNSEQWLNFDSRSDFYGYQISDQGRVSHKDKILSGSLHNDGYVYTTIHGRQYAVHRLVAATFIPNPSNLPEVNHKDGNKQNNFVSNLEWVTRSENQKHAIRNGLQPKVAKTYTGKFTAEQRKQIKIMWDNGTSKREIARKYGVSHTCINDIVNDKYKYSETVNLFEEVARPLVDTLNEMRDSYLTCGDADKKKIIWYSILQLLPESYNQRATVQLNYAVLRNMYHSRKNHKLDEWRQFCQWVHSLPVSELITDNFGGSESE